MVSSWSSLSTIWLLMRPRHWMAFRRTSSISSLNMSTMKSSDWAAKEWNFSASLHNESRVANRTSRNSSSRPWTKAPQAPEPMRLTLWASSSSRGASSAHFWPEDHSPLS
uniref:Putative secreted protein n=1 Tax=Ixodes ricinus TaxID=34613 RepID=A0A6B0UIZ5_IXORI